MIDVFLVTSEGQCGIAEHSAYLREAVYAADTSIQIRGIPESLDPKWFFAQTFAPFPQIVHLNYHAALHSRWTPEHVKEFRLRGLAVVITYHDTGVPNSEQCHRLFEATQLAGSAYIGKGAFVVHEPCADLPGALYWRQGVPAPEWPHHAWRMPGRPVVGTVGFDFPWKNFNLLVEAAAIAGWSTEIIAPKDGTFMPRSEVVARLSGCDATAFLYHTHNTGTSGAIRMGLAARKPVIASKFPYGRQFRDLQDDDLAARVITWVEPNLEQVVEALSRVRIAPLDAGMVRLAERDSWANLGKRYADLYRSLLA